MSSARVSRSPRYAMTDVTCVLARLGDAYVPPVDASAGAARFGELRRTEVLQPGAPGPGRAGVWLYASSSVIFSAVAGRCIR